MAASKTGKSELNNAMDYKEHEATYDIFLWITKWTIAFCVALLVGMMVMFPMAMGFLPGLIVFVILMVASAFAIKR